MLIEQNELQEVYNLIINKKNSIQSLFSDILKSCQENENKADDINNLVEWTKKLIGYDKDE